MASTGETLRLGHHRAARDDDLVETPAGNPAQRRRLTLPRLLVAVAVAVYLIRGWQRLLSPRMFAEDGEVFLSQAHNLGLSAFWEPYAGYLHAIPRIIAALTEPAPLTMIPALYAGVAVLCYLAACSVVLSPRVGWLIPTRTSRAFTFALLCVLVPMREAYGNIANLVAVSGLALFLIALCADARGRRHQASESAAVLLLALSGPFSLITAPLFWWRWRRNGSSHHSLRLAVLVTAGGGLEFSLAALSDRETWPGGPLVFAQIVIERLAGGWVFGDAQMFTGIESSIPVSAALLWLLATTATTLLLLWRVGVLLWSYVAVLMVIATQAFGIVMLASSTAVERQLLVPTAVIVVALVAAFMRTTAGLPKVLVCLCLAAGVGALPSRLAPDPYPLPSDMAALAACERPVCTLPIFSPDGWQIMLISDAR